LVKCTKYEEQHIPLYGVVLSITDADGFVRCIWAGSKSDAITEFESYCRNRAYSVNSSNRSATHFGIEPVEYIHAIPDSAEASLHKTAWKPLEPQVGDGELPNKYWVSKSNQFYTNKDSDESNDFNWSGEVYPHQIDMHEELGVFHRFKDALRVAEALDLSSPEVGLDDWHSVQIEDRLTGTCYAIVWYEHVDVMSGVKTYSLETHNDTKFTKDNMREKGHTFE
jgi:hypothetical protein